MRSESAQPQSRLRPMPSAQTAAERIDELRSEIAAHNYR